MTGAKVWDSDLACTIVEARIWKCMRESAAREWRGSRAVVSMAPRVQSGVLEEAAGEWSERPWD